jgi:NAD-dependent SIR2 family protein deacetylase
LEKKERRRKEGAKSTGSFIQGEFLNLCEWERIPNDCSYSVVMTIVIVTSLKLSPFENFPKAYLYLLFYKRRGVSCQVQRFKRESPEQMHPEVQLHQQRAKGDSF